MSKDPPPQFELRTLLLAMTVLAVLCSLVAWCGPTGRFRLIMVILILATAAGTFIGLLICSYAGLGFGFEDLRWELLRCLALGAITIFSAYALIWVSPGLVFVLPVVMGGCLKLLWSDIEAIEILIVGFSVLSAIGIATGLASHWLG